MIKSVFKTIFILTLSLGLTIPANAGGVQVSDGSAFITKSEMSYELNNLSNRMTQLENTLDSKIDTLVSSYLTRNGIWNGSAQTYLVIKNEKYTSEGDLVKEFVTASKSGLLFTYIVSNYKHALEAYGDRTSQEAMPVANGVATIYINIYSMNDTINSVWSNTKIITWAGQLDVQDDNVNPTGIDLNAADTKDTDFVDTCMFFVNKGETYQLSVSLDQFTQMHWDDASDRQNGLKWAANPYGSSKRTRWNGTYNEGNTKYCGRGSYYTYSIGIGDTLVVY